MQNVVVGRALQDSESDPDSVRFRIFPVNLIRSSFFKIRAKKNVLTMGGGGTRAMCGTTGQLRAMHSMDLLKEVLLGHDNHDIMSVHTV